MIIEAIAKTDSFKMLAKESANGTFPKALLLIGKDKFFLHEFAKAVSMLILDGKVDAQSENAQKIMAGAHPDVKSYPLKDKLLVADSEEIVEESFIKPIFADRKVFIIHDIDNSMESAQNKLLKVVEEPSKNVYMIITCTAPDMVLPTIRSRCNKVEVGRLVDEEVRKLLPRADEELAELVLAVAEGQVGKAQAYAKMRNFEELCKDCLEVFTKMKASKDVLAHAKKLLSYKDQTSLILQVLALVVEDLLKIKSHIEPRLPYKEQLSAVTGDYTVRALCEITALLDKVAKEKQYNVNMTLAIENLLLNILEVKYLCK